MPHPAKRFGSRRGSSLIELAFIMPLLVLLAFGAMQVGIVLGRVMTVVQLVRNAGDMYARNVDFNITSNRQVLLLAASGLHMTLTGGSGTIILSTVVRANTGTTNAGLLVISERFVIGNSALGASHIGTPSGSIWPDSTQPTPNGIVHDYQNQTSARATNMPAVFSTGSTALAANERVLVAEVYHQPSDILGVNSYLPLNLMYYRAFF